MNTKHLLLSSIAIPAAFSQAVAAQNAPQESIVIEEVTVTAQKRAQSTQEIGVSVTAFSGDKLQKFGFTDSPDIVAQVPGLNVGTPVGEGNNPSFTLRGVGLNDFNDNNEGPIAIYLDEAYQAALPGLTFQLFDVERVEVLRGPQGTIYGRNATGGLMKFVSRKPTEETEGYLRAEAGSYTSFLVEGAISGPLSDTVRARLAASYKTNNGYVENRIGENANQANSFSIRGSAEIDVADNGLLSVSAFYSSSDTVAPQYQHQATLGATGADNLPFCPTDVPRDIWCYADTDDDNFAGEYDREGRLDIEVKGVHATYVHDFGGVELTNTFSYQATDKLHEEDTDVGPQAGIEPTFRSEIDALTNEFRLSGDFDGGVWQFGVFYLDTKVESANDLQVNWRGDFAALLDSDPAAFDGGLAAFTPGFPTDGTLVPAIFFDVDYTQDTQSYAGFGQVEYRLSDRLNLTVGARYTKENRDFDYINQAPAGFLLNNLLNGVGEANYLSLRAGDTNGFAAVVGAGPADVVSADASRIRDDNFLGKVTLDYDISDDALIYASWSRGFKSGGFNAGFLDQTDFVTSDQVAFDAETLDSYEIGFKWTSSDRTIRLNGAGFYYDYNDFQALTFQGLSQFITNGEATFYGAEAELTILPAAGWDIQLGASLLSTDVDGVNVQGTELNDREAVLAPNFTANGSVSYTAGVPGGELTSIVSFNHQGSHFFDITNSENSRQGAYTLFDLRFVYTHEDTGLKISAFAKNLFDKEYLVYTFDFTGPGGYNQRFFGKPRWLGVGLNYNF
ncbi:TonB-dependent receptor [Kordiimonas laminariae]|uniref:TonB-dependent receptor n=1 Tax=Kordiimonas laminariae TaxID=2917717 RepID=UPI001FF49DE3|nr:TonB-dependent receptor [Kordiimonas laminariae]MCK0067819.1 TonB-dependent receptor [Kordiimonas laminariae]